MEELKKGNILPQLNFFIGGQNLELQNRILQIGINQDSKDFLALFQTEMCKQLPLIYKLKIHTETENIFYNNQNTKESISDIFSTQQDYTKKLLQQEFQTSVRRLYP